MRECVGFCLIVLLCGFAWGQGDFVPPGTYAQPSAPRLTTPSASPEAVGTPSLSLDSPSSIAGASNATAGNIAGAANSTLSVDSTGSGVQVNQPLWYSPGVQLNVLNYQATVSSEQDKLARTRAKFLLVREDSTGERRPSRAATGQPSLQPSRELGPKQLGSTPIRTSHVLMRTMA